MQPRELFLSYFDIKELVNKNGRVNHINLGAGTNFFAVIKSGRAVFTSADKRVELFPGELLYIPRGLVYSSEWYGEDVCRFYSLPFVFRYFSENGNFSLQKLGCGETDFTAALDDMYENIKNEPAKALAVFYALYAEATPKMEKSRRAFEDSRVSKAIRYMESHAAEDFDVPMLARMCGMSESGFYVEFKKLTSYTPVEYKNILRCRTATELLCNTSDTVEVIAEKVGCSDPSYLRRLLYKELKKTPKQIRFEKQLI